MSKEIEVTEEYVQKAARQLFECHLKLATNEVKRQGGAIDYIQAGGKYNRCLKEIKKQDKIYEMPLIGKMIYNYRYNRICKTMRTYEMIISLFENLRLNVFYTCQIDIDRMRRININKYEIYNQYYREDYEKTIIEMINENEDAQQTCNNNSL